MRLKLYRADDVETAVKAAGQELGEDAMLICVEKSQTHEIPYGRYRVVFANGLPSLPAVRPNMPDPIRDRVPNWKELRSSLGLLADQLSVPPPASARQEVKRFLIECGVRCADVPAVEHAIENSGIKELLDQTIKPYQQSRASNISVFVGPSGSGKSTAVDKLAFLESRSGKRVLVIRAFQKDISANPARVDSRILELCAPSVRELEVIRHIQPAPDVVLIDSASHLAGFPPEQAALVRDWFQANNASVHLVLSAVTRLQEWLNYTAQFCQFRPSRVLLTHVDEVVSWAGVWSAVLGSAMKCSFFSAGPFITDPIESATPEWFLEGFTELSEKVMQIESTKLAAMSAVSTN